MPPNVSEIPKTEAPAQTAGAWLREARQQRGLHIAALAAMLKVPQAKLEALEGNRFDDLPDITFARALAKAMCRVLKIDPGPVMDLLPRGGERALDVSRGINQPYRERGGREEGRSLSWLQRPMVWVAALLLLAAAAVVWVPATWLNHAGEPDAGGVAEVSDAVIAPESTAAASAPLLIEAPEAVVAPMASAPLVVAAASAPAPSSLPAGTVALALKVSADSWVEIIDARGQVLVSRLLKPGDAPELAGLPPFKVKVGNVNATELSLRGSKVDLVAQSKDNVARIELN